MKPSRLPARYWVQHCETCRKPFDSRERFGACPHRERSADYERIYDRLEERIITNCRCTGAFPKYIDNRWQHKCRVNQQPIVQRGEDQ